MKKIHIAAVAVAVCALLAAGCSPGASVFASQAAVQSAASSAAAPSGPIAAKTMSPSASASASGTASEQPYKVAVDYDLATEENSQKSVDEGHSPWRLDPAFVAQVFVSLQLEPGGIEGDYPIPYEDFQVTKQSGSEAVVTVNNEKSPTATVYLKQLVRQGSDGIWTVVGYDPK
jgi:hypothetical protein